VLCLVGCAVSIAWPHAGEGRLVPVTLPFQVNTEIRGDQKSPRVLTVDGGNFVVIWRSAVIENSSVVESVRGRLFDADGDPLGGEFQFEGLAPPPYSASRGDSLVGWISSEVIGSTALGRFALNGTRLEVWPVEQAPAIRSRPALASGRPGETVLTWDESPFGAIRAQTFGADGRPVGPRPSFVVATEGPPDNEGVVNPRVSAASDGSFMVAWRAEFSRALWTRHFDAAGLPRAERFAAVPPGEFGAGGFVTCMDRGSGSSVVAWGRKARRFDQDGQPQNPICTGVGSFSAACLGGDRFAVADTRTIYGLNTSPIFLVIRAFDAADRVLGTTLIRVPAARVITLSSLPHVASIGTDTVAVTWQDCAAECETHLGCAGSGCEAYAQLFRLTEEPDCTGDCDGDGRVSIEELVGAVQLALQGPTDSGTNPTICPALETTADCKITVAELVRGVRNGLEGCAS
jgi:hypothetical protein